jgi:glycosyltransferase involved in cell wall biosynthesis
MKQAALTEVQKPEGGIAGRETGKKTVYLYGARSKTWLSGTPYYLARAIEADGKEDFAFDVVDIGPKRVREIPLTYFRWCATTGSRRSHLFLFSQEYYDRSGRDIVVPDDVTPYFIVWGQCIPASILAYRRANPDARIIVYNDVTLLELMAMFDYASDIPVSLRERLVQDEKLGYAQADFIAVFHEDNRANLVRNYGVPPHKIRVIGRGVNLSPELVDQPAKTKRSAVDHKFHMMVVGKGPKRKGVFRLIEAIDALTPEEQNSIVLTVAGPEPSELPSRPYLRPLGFLDYDRREELAAEMAASDLGVLLSNADSLPGSIWEFLALKVPVWVSKLPCIETLAGYPAIIEDLSHGTPALIAKLRSFLGNSDLLATLVAVNSKSLTGLTWQGPAKFFGKYIRLDHVPPDLTGVKRVTI